jgi:SAM-dependent methyltransferase
MHFASYYRWLVATSYWGLPLNFSGGVLDIGGDDGQFLARIQAPFKVGMDLSPVAPRVSFPWIRADGRRLPFADGSFGDIFAFDVIEPIEDDRSVVAEACRLLEEGGVLWLSTTAEKYTVLPGGPVQARFERSWGHVRRGYSTKMILALLPGGVEADVWYWNEPTLRAFYVPLYYLKRFHGPLARKLVRPLAKIDALKSQGQSGHLFARITKFSNA